VILGIVRLVRIANFAVMVLVAGVENTALDRQMNWPLNPASSTKINHTMAPDMRSAKNAAQTAHVLAKN
jgi:hypothetical protein